VRFVDVWDAVDRLHDVMRTGAHLDERFAERAAVT
jgi:kynureninase